MHKMGYKYSINLQIKMYQTTKIEHLITKHVQQYLCTLKKLTTIFGTSPYLTFISSSIIEFELSNMTA